METRAERPIPPRVDGAQPGIKPPPQSGDDPPANIKDFFPMGQPVDPIDQILGELRHTMGNTLMLLDICLQLRRNSAHLVQLVRSMPEVREMVPVKMPM
jgi:hypothetical protein